MSAENPTFAIISQGCAANFGDGERIARALAAQHPNSRILFSLPDRSTPESDCGNAPDAIYLNVCTVKGNAGAIKLLRNATEAFPEAAIFITGCAPKDFREEVAKITDKVIYTSHEEIVTLEQGKAAAIESTHGALRESPFVGIVNIEEGCLDACAFCSTHLVKGRLRSYTPEAIEQQVQRLVDDGCKEIQLTGQDCACYGFDIGTDLAELTQRILTHVTGNYKIRLGMGNPRHIRPYQDALLDCFADERLYKFIHVPVQSGSDRVLAAMNRRHTVEDYTRVADAIAERFGDRFTLSTDLIIGHPGESPEDFEQTLRLVEHTRPTVANITRYVPRPGTPAARYEAGASPEYAPVPDSVKHERSAILAVTFQRIAEENNRKWVGTECTVVTEKRGHREGTTICRNEAYRPVAVQGGYPAGTTLRVRITGAEPFALIAEIL